MKRKGVTRITKNFLTQFSIHVFQILKVKWRKLLHQSMQLLTKINHGLYFLNTEKTFFFKNK